LQDRDAVGCDECRIRASRGAQLTVGRPFDPQCERVAIGIAAAGAIKPQGAFAATVRSVPPGCGRRVIHYRDGRRARWLNRVRR
jgi:hypothetical protein